MALEEFGCLSNYTWVFIKDKIVTLNDYFHNLFTQNLIVVTAISNLKITDYSLSRVTYAIQSIYVSIF